MALRSQGEEGAAEEGATEGVSPAEEVCLEGRRNGLWICARRRAVRVWCGLRDAQDLLLLSICSGSFVKMMCVACQVLQI